MPTLISSNHRSETQIFNSLLHFYIKKVWQCTRNLLGELNWLYSGDVSLPVNPQTHQTTPPDTDAVGYSSYPLSQRVSRRFSGFSGQHCADSDQRCRKSWTTLCSRRSHKTCQQKLRHLLHREQSGPRKWKLCSWRLLFQRPKLEIMSQ